MSVLSAVALWAAVALLPIATVYGGDGTGAPILEVFAGSASKPAAIEVARRNANRHGVPLSLLCGDLASAIFGGYELVVANLPYIPSGQVASLPLEVRHDPNTALDGGPDGTLSSTFSNTSRTARSKSSETATSATARSRFSDAAASWTCAVRSESSAC